MCPQVLRRREYLWKELLNGVACSNTKKDKNISFILGSSNMIKTEIYPLNFSLEGKVTDGKIVSMVMGLRPIGFNGK